MITICTTKPICRYGERKKRKDCLEEECPLALAHIANSIIKRTQPSPCAVKTKHDYSDKKNHYRSGVDHSLVCAIPDLCQTEGVRYMMGTKKDLYYSCMADLAAAVSFSRGGGEDIRSIEFTPKSFVLLDPFSCPSQHIVL